MVHHFRPVESQSYSRLIPVAPNVWMIKAKEAVYFRPPMQPRYPYPYRSVVIRLDGNHLFILSPIQPTPEIRSDMDAIGGVSFLVSPNHLHHLYLGDWSQAYPDARVYASPGLAAKRQDLTFHQILTANTPEPEWTGQLDQCVFGTGTGWFDELVFFHRASGTVIFTDLIMDFDPSRFSSIARVTTRWNQMYQHTPRGVQFANIFNRAVLRNALQSVRGWEPERLVVAHSPWLCVEGKQQVIDLLDAAFNWLTPQPLIVETLMTMLRFFTLLLVVLPIHALIVFTADIVYPKLLNCCYPAATIAY